MGRESCPLHQPDEILITVFIDHMDHVVGHGMCPLLPVGSYVSISLVPAVAAKSALAEVESEMLPYMMLNSSLTGSHTAQSTGTLLLLVGGTLIHQLVVSSVKCSRVVILLEAGTVSKGFTSVRGCAG